MGFGAILGTLVGVSVAAAQSPQGLGVPDVLNLVGFGAGAGALVAWGSQKEKVLNHASRLKVLEDDRVTRHEFDTMGGNIRNIERDMRQVREMLERRQRPRD